VKKYNYNNYYDNDDNSYYDNYGNENNSYYYYNEKLDYSKSNLNTNNNDKLVKSYSTENYNNNNNKVIIKENIDKLENKENQEIFNKNLASNKSNNKINNENITKDKELLNESNTTTSINSSNENSLTKILCLNNKTGINSEVSICQNINIESKKCTNDKTSYANKVYDDNKKNIVNKDSYKENDTILKVKFNRKEFFKKRENCRFNYIKLLNDNEVKEEEKVKIPDYIADFISDKVSKFPIYKYFKYDNNQEDYEEKNTIINNTLIISWEAILNN